MSSPMIKYLTEKIIIWEWCRFSWKDWGRMVPWKSSLVTVLSLQDWVSNLTWLADCNCIHACHGTGQRRVCVTWDTTLSLRFGTGSPQNSCSNCEDLGWNGMSHGLWKSWALLSFLKSADDKLPEDSYAWLDWSEVLLAFWSAVKHLRPCSVCCLT